MIDDEIRVYTDTNANGPVVVKYDEPDMTNVVIFPIKRARIGGSCDVCGSPRVEGEIKHLSDCTYADYYDKVWFEEDGTRCAVFAKPFDEVGY